MIDGLIREINEAGFVLCFQLPFIAIVREGDDLYHYSGIWAFNEDRTTITDILVQVRNECLKINSANSPT